MSIEMFLVWRIRPNQPVDQFGACMDLHGAIQILDVFINSPAGKVYIANPSWAPRTSWIAPNAFTYIVLGDPHKKYTYSEAMKMVRKPCPEICGRAKSIGTEYSREFTPEFTPIIKPKRVVDPIQRLFRLAIHTIDNPITETV
ncbi:MAG: hypothetical protein WA766_09160 [Candidatus Acidiferrales bacterium]